MNMLLSKYLCLLLWFGRFCLSSIRISKRRQYIKAIMWIAKSEIYIYKFTSLNYNYFKFSENFKSLLLWMFVIYLFNIVWICENCVWQYVQTDLTLYSWHSKRHGLCRPQFWTQWWPISSTANRCLVLLRAPVLRAWMRVCIIYPTNYQHFLSQTTNPFNH